MKNILAVIGLASLVIWAGVGVFGGEKANNEIRIKPLHRHYVSDETTDVTSDETMVVVSKRGKFHRIDEYRCKYADKSAGWSHPIALSEALDRGYIPCKKCWDRDEIDKLLGANDDEISSSGEAEEEAVEVQYAEVYSSKMSLNHATYEDIISLSYVGPVKARLVVDNQPFYSWQECLAIRGIGTATISKLRAVFTL